jgi:hypothetical protein
MHEYFKNLIECLLPSRYDKQGGALSLDQVLGECAQPLTISEEKPVATQWFYSLDGRMMLGPCSSLEMKRLASEGQILPTFRVRRKGRVKTVMAKNVKGLFVPAAE